MSAARQLDMEMAKLMGHEVVYSVEGMDGPIIKEKEGVYWPVPFYSSSWLDMALVVEWLEKLQIQWCIRPRMIADDYVAIVGVHVVIAPTYADLPWALCEATKSYYTEVHRG